MQSNKLDNYKTAQHPVPPKMLRWHLYGAGLENLGREGEPEEVDVPRNGPDELLVRQDACGLCFSDTKVIGLGTNHPRMTGRDLGRDPVTLGHEVSCTVIDVGANLRDRFKPGDRFVVQADVFYKGKSMAYGYAIRGGLAEYSVIPREIIEGDEGCYLLPIKADTGYVESALTEPWACVVSSYAQAHREGMKDAGAALVIIADDAESVEWSELLSEGHTPARIAIAAAAGKGDSLKRIAAERNVETTDLRDSDFTGARAQVTNDRGFDDIIAVGSVSADVIEAASAMLADHSIFNITRNTPIDRPLSLDIGRIHYNWHHYLGVFGGSPAAAYREERTSELKSGGAAWFIGAGGPMGQMHVQRAVLQQNGPALIVASDVDAARLQSVADRFGASARERSVQLVTLNPKELGEQAFNTRLQELTGGRGFDDIVSLVPVAAIIEHAADYIADGGWFNIFAGVARGTMATLDINRVISGRVRFLGSSGSSLSDMRETLKRVEEDELSTNASLAAIGGMEAVVEGMRAVKEGWFPGKTLIFPHIHGLKLTPLPELKAQYPSVFAKLKDGQFWTQEAEDELLSLTVAREGE